MNIQMNEMLLTFQRKEKYSKGSKILGSKSDKLIIIRFLK